MIIQRGASPGWQSFHNVDPRPDGRHPRPGPAVDNLEEKLQHVAAVADFAGCVRDTRGSLGAKPSHERGCDRRISLRGSAQGELTVARDTEVCGPAPAHESRPTTAVARDELRSIGTPKAVRSPRVAGSLGPLIGNRALTRLITGKPTARRLMRAVAKLANGEEVWYEQPVTKEMVDNVAARIAAAGVTIASADAVVRTKARWQKSADETVLNEIKVLRWDYEDLLGLADALDVAKHVRGLRAGTVAAPGPKRDPDWKWQVGKITGTVTRGMFSEHSTERRDQAETLLDNPTKLASLALTGECSQKAFEMEPEPTGAEAPPDKKRRFTRMARGVFVHEIGHTIYAAFSKEWLALVNVQKDPRDLSKVIPGTGAAAAEPKPTEYAMKNNEEDFCESFMLHLLYPDKLRDRSPLRATWFEQRAAYFARPPA